jgi:ABC-2 type transport system ATP-binding protein
LSQRAPGPGSPLGTVIGEMMEAAEPGQVFAIEARHLTKRFGEVVAVDELDLAIRRGEIFGFLGPNGAGKTTTIRMMVGLTPPTSGQVRIRGLDLARDSLAARAIMAYLPDEPYVYDKLTGREFMHFVAGLYRVPPDVAGRRMAELLPLFDLEDRADDLIEDYSHGMRQKVLVAAALMHDPQVMFLDEPSVGLDPRSARLLRDVLRQRAQKGAGIFLSTHVLEIAERLCDRIGIIDKGCLVGLGTVEQLHAQAAVSGSLEDIFLELTGGPAYAAESFLE